MESTKLFGANRPSGQAEAPQAAAPADGAPETGSRRGRHVRPVMTLAGGLLLIAACVLGYRWTTSLGRRVVQAHPVDARIEIANPPAWMDPQIVAALLQEAYDFAQRDQATYQRARNILDSEILRDFAELYTGVDYSGARPVDRQSAGFNAWIRQITQVRRQIARDKSIQTIQIFAEWRRPAAWVRMGSGDELCLIDDEGVRLPGDYHLAEKAHSRLMVIAGMDLPEIDGKRAVPAPGGRWTSGTSGALGDDLAAGMKLAELLQRQRFASQIAAIDVSNFAGRRNPREPWIVFDTIWTAADGAPRVVQWGRPIGQERTYEVQASRKIKTLNDLYVKFARIDADRDLVDIRTEVVWLAKPAQKPDEAPPTSRPTRISSAGD